LGSGKGGNRLQKGKVSRKRRKNLETSDRRRGGLGSGEGELLKRKQESMREKSARNHGGRECQ